MRLQLMRVIFRFVRHAKMFAIRTHTDYEWNLRWNAPWKAIFTFMLVKQMKLNIQFQSFSIACSLFYL